jgi:FAD:protein FMN transferase
MTLVVKPARCLKNAAAMAAFFCITLMLGACSGELEMDRLSGKTMGTTWSVVIANPIAAHNPEALQAEIEATLQSVNQQMSTYDPNSEISRFNNASVDEWFPVSELFALTTAKALGFSRISNGAFDPTVGPVVNLWGFGSEAAAEELPTDAMIDEAKDTVGFEAISVRAPEAPGGAALKKNAPRQLDLSAIAKGLGVDQMYAVLDDKGYSNFLVEIGGEIRVKGNKDGMGWRIAVEKPVRGERQVEETLALGNIAVATSGDYRNYREIDGVAYSHTIDPATGRPVTHQLASVTVADESCAMADGWATTLLVLGPTEGFQLATRQNLPAMFIERTADGFAVKYTPRFERLLAGVTE